MKKICVVLFIFLLPILSAQELLEDAFSKKAEQKAQEAIDKREKKYINENEKYRTPRAGEELNTTFLGMNIHVPVRQRDKLKAISIGADIYLPKLGNDVIVPFAAFYYRDTWQDKKRNIRAVIALFFNDINFYDGTWNDNGFEFAAHWKNYTIPFSSSLEISDTELDDSEIYWGYVRGGIGFGWRTFIAPHEVDSYFSIHAFYEPGLLYFEDTGNTGDNYIIPSCAYEDRIHLKIRLDTLERNIMELAHSGYAAGFDYTHGHRYDWKSHGYNASFKKDDTETYNLFEAFFMFAGGPDFLSERHRFIFSFHGGFAFNHELDRYSAPRLGGGPSGDETEALSSSPIPGARFDEFIVSRYLLFSLEYRLEIFFFMYLHVKGVLGPIRRMELKDNSKIELSDNELVGSISIGLTSGFVWDSQIQIQYTHDRGITGGEERENGHNVLINWSKSF